MYRSKLPRFWICWALAAMLDFPIPLCHSFFQLGVCLLLLVSPSRFVVTNMYRSKLGRWPKTQYVTMTHSLKGQLYDPKRDVVTFLTKSTLWPKSRQRDVVTFIQWSTLRPKTWRCDVVTFRIRSSLWPKSWSKTVIRSKRCSKTVNLEIATLSHSLQGVLQQSGKKGERLDERLGKRLEKRGNT